MQIVSVPSAPVEVKRRNKKMSLKLNDMQILQNFSAHHKTTVFML